MWKKWIWGCVSLLLLLGANLRPCCSVELNGRTLPGLYDGKTLARAETAAKAAAEELLSGPAAEPAMKKSWRLSLFPAKGGRLPLTDALLCGYTGVKKGNGVSVNGVFLGTVEDAGLLREKTRNFILSQMPSAAVFGSISGELSIDTVYTRRNHDTPYSDMLLLISGMAPVVYTDENGRLC